MKKINIDELTEVKHFISVVSQDKTIDLSNFNTNLKTIKIYELSEGELREKGAGIGDAVVPV